MPRTRLTQLAVDRLPAPKIGRVIYWDRLLPGFGLRLTANGAKSWVAMSRVASKPLMETIGALAKIPKVEEARQAARDSMEKPAAGSHPVVEKRVEAAGSVTNTVAAAIERYLAEGGRTSKRGRPLRPGTATEWRRIFAHDALPRWGERPLSEIAKADVLELVNDKAARRERKRQGRSDGAAVQSGKMLTRLRTFFPRAAANDLVQADPTAGVRLPAKEAQRDRVLSAGEIRAFWNAAERLGMPFDGVFRLLLLTAQREVEVAGMLWCELDLDKRVWTIPGARVKNGKPHIVHLSALAAEMIERVPRIAGQDLLFSGTGKTPVSGFSQAKARLDRRMTDESRRAAYRRPHPEPPGRDDSRRCRRLQPVCLSGRAQGCA
jgi:integrase